MLQCVQVSVGAYVGDQSFPNGRRLEGRARVWRCCGPLPIIHTQPLFVARAAWCPGGIEQCLDTVSIVTWLGGTVVGLCWHLVGGGQGCREHPTMHRDVPTAECPAQTSRVPSPRDSVLHDGLHFLPLFACIALVSKPSLLPQ